MKRSHLEISFGGIFLGTDIISSESDHLNSEACFPKRMCYKPWPIDVSCTISRYFSYVEKHGNAEIFFVLQNAGNPWIIQNLEVQLPIQLNLERKEGIKL